MSSDLHWTAGVHHDGSPLYVSNGLPRFGDHVEIRLRTPPHAPIRAIFLRTTPDGEAHHEPMHLFRQEGGVQWWKAELRVTMPAVHYRFKLLTDEGAYVYNALGADRADGPDAADFKLVAGFQGAPWIEETVFYQIFPDRFRDGDPALTVRAGEYSRRGFTTQQRPWGAPPLPYREAGNLDFYGGDLPGIVEKLDYLADLGITALYLTPIFTAETNHRYDILDFHNVDPHLGGNAALADLSRALHERGMRLMLDVTLNHVGSRHPWFLAAQEDPNAPTAEFFTFDKHPDDYASWLGHKSLVKWNYRSQRLRDAMYRAPDSALRRWLREPYAIDGWRLDVYNMQARQGAHQLGDEVGRELRAAVKQDRPDAYILGEHFFDGTPALQGDQLDATMNYQGFTIPVWRWLSGRDSGWASGVPQADMYLLPTDALVRQWARYLAATPWALARQQFSLLNSHDTARILTTLDGNKALQKLAAVLLLSFPGAASVYYGEEIGMEGGHDPDCRRCMPWDEAAWDHDLRAHYQRLIALRKTAPALREGGIQFLYADDGLLVYQRQSPTQRLVIIGYRGPGGRAEAAIPVWHAGLADGAQLVDALGGTAFTVEAGRIRLTSLEPGAALILEERRA
ncbi:MAG: maltodextrin glucosidase [Anaerolineae bacterium]|nr:maltodextrin glucosidase [Anaerolineae bacterium]